MHQGHLSLRRGLFSMLAASACSLAALPVAAEPILGLLGELDGTGNALITFDSATPGTSGAPVVVTGLMGDVRLVGVDLRPTTGVIYGLGNAGGLYTINPVSAVATSIGTLSVALTSIAGNGVDFNPVPDLAGAASLRITNIAGQNLRANVNPGMIGVTVVDMNLNGAATGLFASAYTDNDRNPATMTMLFGIGNNPSGGLALYRQNPANDGTLALIGNLGTSGASVGLDVSASGDTFASIAAQGSNGANFFRIDLTSGAASLIGSFAAFSGYSVFGITALTAPPPVAAIPEPETYAMMLAGLAALAAVARRRRSRAAAA